MSRPAGSDTDCPECLILGRIRGGRLRVGQTAKLGDVLRPCLGRTKDFHIPEVVVGLAEVVNTPRSSQRYDDSKPHQVADGESHGDLDSSIVIHGRNTARS